MVRRNEALPKKAVEEKQTVVHLNIQNSNIANLNLGSQVGIINTALETISSGGGNQQEFANAIKELTEAIISQKKLKDDQKRKAVHAESTKKNVSLAHWNIMDVITVFLMVSI